MSISKDVAATEPLVSVQIKLLGLKKTMSVGKGPKTQTIPYFSSLTRSDSLDRHTFNTDRMAEVAAQHDPLSLRTRCLGRAGARSRRQSPRGPEEAYRGGQLEAG